MLLSDGNTLFAAYRHGMGTVSTDQFLKSISFIQFSWYHTPLALIYKGEFSVITLSMWHYVDGGGMCSAVEAEISLKFAFGRSDRSHFTASRTRGYVSCSKYIHYFYILKIK